MIAVIPNWFMYIAIFIGATFFGKALITSLIHFFDYCLNGIYGFIKNPHKYINEQSVHYFFNGEE
ncbi:hypothetical protein [Fructilactobacillus sanfranciscensis]|uniref:hypothetical protein n=1 Tax=Fructilactobacillus sanfranciscensis TaxID=1625 RepID=UPI000CD41068|nr:hypothetical protein [Fructilactobacillus sanfranciscensis]POH18623.1 hypothetical protein BGL45_06690 [Fructilactobacillus sanfranciscensis]